MTTGFTDLVENTIDAAIRSFSPGDEGSYAHWDSELQRLESRLSDFLSTPEGQHGFASVRAQRIAMAFDTSKYELVLELSGQFVHDVPIDHPSFFTVASLRACCLHRVGAHGEEVQEILELVRKAEVQNHEYISYLKHLATMHPGSIPQDQELVEKMWKAIAELRALGYDTLPTPEESEQTGLEQLAVETWSELRRVNREKGEALLAETP